MSTAPTTTTPRVASTEWIAAGGVVASGVAVAMDPAGIEDGPILCPIRLVTGLPCPGCGLTRSWVYGVHGQWGDSFASHPFGLPLLLAVLALAAVVVVRRVRRDRPPSIDRIIGHPVAKIALAAFLVHGLVRLALAL